MDEPVRITDEGDGTLAVSLFGDIDFANSPSVRETIRAAVSDQRARSASMSARGRLIRASPE